MHPEQVSAARAASEFFPAFRSASAASRWAVIAMLMAAPVACGAQAPAATPRSAASGAGEAVTRIFDVKLSNGKAVDTADTLRVKRGEAVQLRWSSDTPMNLHLHGYDLAISLQAGVPASTSFVASLPGRFPVSNHTAGARERAVLYIEVLP